MSLEEKNQKNKGYRNFRGSMHIGMGGLYLVIGGAVLYMRYFGAVQLSAGWAYTIGIAMLLYGIFRIWRGWTYMRGK